MWWFDFSKTKIPFLLGGCSKSLKWISKSIYLPTVSEIYTNTRRHIYLYISFTIVKLKQIYMLGWKVWQNRKKQDWNSVQSVTASIFFKLSANVWNVRKFWQFYKFLQFIAFWPIRAIFCNFCNYLKFEKFFAIQ